MELRYTDTTQDKLVAYNLTAASTSDSVSTLTFASISGCSLATAPQMSVVGDSLVMTCASALAYMNVASITSLQLLTTPAFGPPRTVRFLMAPPTATNEWYLDTDFGVERWSFDGTTPTYETISASGFYSTTTVNYVNNRNSGTIYWLEAPLSPFSAPITATLYQLGTSPSAFLNPVPFSLNILFSGLGIRSFNIDPTINRLLVFYKYGTSSASQTADLALIGFGNCNTSAISCSDCVGEGDLECGWCATSSTSGSCVPARSCSTRWFQDTCPLLNKVSSIDPLVTGLPFVLQLDATLFSGYNITCSLRSTTTSQLVPLSIIAAAAPLCGLSTSGDPTLKTIAGDYYVEITLDGYITYPTPQLVNFVNCSEMTNCHSCTSASDGCNWCVYDGACVNTDTACSVSGPASERPSLPGACPVQGPITPSAAMLPLASGSAVIIQATSLITPTTGLPYSCSFALANNVTVLTTSGNFISTSSGVSCSLPSPPTGFIGSSSVSLLFRGHPFADNTNTFTFYDCTSATLNTCSTCLSALNAQCAWNAATASCNIASSCPSGTDCRSACPTIVQPLSLSSFHVTDDIGATVTINGTYFTSTSQSSWTCDFGIGTPTTGTWISSTQISCPVPTFTNVAFFTSIQTIYPSTLTVLHNGAIYTPSVSVNWYSCGGLNCSSCLNGNLAPKCRWNFDGYSCGLLTASQLPSCPQIQSMSDTYAHVSGGLSITITPALAPNTSLSYRCAWTSFSNAISPIYVTATLSAGVWTCTAPNVTAFTSSASMTSLFSIQAQSSAAGWTDFTVNPQVFTFFNCMTATSCSTCLLSSQCYWVNYTACTTTVGGSDIDPLHLQCPKLVSVNPTIQSVSSIVNATAIVTGLPSTSNWAASYMCRWQTPVGSFIHTAVTKINSTALSCPFQRTYHDLNTAVLTFDLTYGTTTPLTVNQLSYEVYDCSLGTSCGLCAQIHPMCGWCSEVATCSDNWTCAAKAAGSTWVRDTCPFVDLLTPPYTALGHATAVVFTGSFGAPSTALQCRYTYGSTVQLVLANTTSSTSVSCLLPNIITPTSITIELGQMVTVKKKRALSFVKYVPDVFPFDFFNCAPPSNASSCGECYSAIQNTEIDPRCGWCGYDAFCADGYSCNSQYGAHFTPTTNNECPRLVSVVPSSGTMKGGTTVTLTGSFFFQSTSGTSCGFGSQLVPATVTSPTTLTCHTPSAASLSLKKSGQSVAVDVFWNDVKFTLPGDFRFTYKNQDNTATIVIATVLSVIGFVLLLLVVLFVVFYRKIMENRDKRKFLKLREPDYSAVAFSSTKGIDLVLTPSDQKALNNFMKALDADENFTIIRALSQSAPGNQADYLCRAAIYYYQTKNRALDLLMSFVTAEVKASEHEGTLFRASSFACKLFNQYARLQGGPYLWKTLGFYVNQLAEFAREERSEERDDILGPGSMEVDPDRYDGDEAAAPSEFDIRLNQYELLTRASKILKAIFASLPNMRPEFRKLCARVKQEVGAKFPDNNADYKAVGGFIFLRFICPSIMAPHVYGLLQTPPNETAQRYFVLLSKSLQNLANETLPGTNEEFMARMNEFITKNLIALHGWVDNLCEGADAAVAVDPELTVPDDLFYSGTALMQNMLVEEWDHVQKHLSEEQIANLERTQERGPIGKKPKASSGAPPRKK